MLADLFRQELAELLPPRHAPPVPVPVVVDFTVGAFMAVLGGWFEAGATEAPEVVDARFRTLATAGVVAGLGLSRRR
jgi:hypothetical protein